MKSTSTSTEPLWLTRGGTWGRGAGRLWRDAGGDSSQSPSLDEAHAEQLGYVTAGDPKGRERLKGKHSTIGNPYTRGKISLGQAMLFA